MYIACSLVCDSFKSVIMNLKPQVIERGINYICN